MEMAEKKELVKQALAVAERAHAPYSNFHVGAAAIDKNGKVFTGCNVENASFGLTCCAERIALFKSVTEGAAPIVALAVITLDGEGFLPPCGACRQVIHELAPDALILLANKSGDFIEKSVQELLPGAFVFEKKS